jgi:hypothetical protein
MVVLLVIIVVVLFVVNGGLGGNQASTDSGLQPGQQVGQDTLNQECQTGEDANERLDCRIVGFVNSVQAYWSEEGAAQLGVQYRESFTTIFDGSINTGCGNATSEVGPFYCPADEMVYLDLGFYDVLEQLGADNAPLAQGYVIAHEYGHHIQDITGVLERARDGQTGPQSNGVRVELQADCYAGAWVGNAVETGYLEPITDAQIQDALEAARAVGDDRIQQQTQGQVNQESWTHGSSAQRQSWFTTGYRSADPRQCDTFSGNV